MEKAHLFNSCRDGADTGLLLPGAGTCLQQCLDISMKREALQNGTSHIYDGPLVFRIVYRLPHSSLKHKINGCISFFPLCFLLIGDDVFWV